MNIKKRGEDWCRDSQRTWKSKWKQCQPTLGQKGPILSEGSTRVWKKDTTCTFLQVRTSRKGSKVKGGTKNSVLRTGDNVRMHQGLLLAKGSTRKRGPCKVARRSVDVFGVEKEDKMALHHYDVFKVDKGFWQPSVLRSKFSSLVSILNDTTLSYRRLIVETRYRKKGTRREFPRNG